MGHSGFVDTYTLLRNKLRSRVGLVSQLAESSWGADVTILCTVILGRVQFMAQHYASLWCRSAHTRLIIKPINNALRIVTRCLRPTPTKNLLL